MEDRLREEDQHCPVCGYYCLGRGGYGCIDKPSMIKNTRATDPLMEEMAEALEELEDMFDPTSRVGEIINKPLQKYRARQLNTEKGG